MRVGSLFTIVRRMSRVSRHLVLQSCQRSPTDVMVALYQSALPQSSLFPPPTDFPPSTSTAARISAKRISSGQTSFPVGRTLLSTYQEALCLTHYEYLGGGGVVKVDSQWALDTGLQPTQGYSIDGKSVYVVAMYHQLHCLVSCLQSELGERGTDFFARL